MTQLGVALLGCGFQGAIHARNIVESERANLVLCADVDLQRAAELASSCGDARATDSIDDVWEAPEVEAVVIASTTHTHHELALTAARQHKHMIIEKPMALTVKECLDIERASEDAGVVTVVGYKFRFTRAVLGALDAISEPTVLVAQTLYDPTPQGSHAWVNDPMLSGGRLTSSLVHSIDLLRYLARDEIVRVFAEGSTKVAAANTGPDTATITLLFERGAIASLVHGTAAASGLVSTWSFQAASAGVNATIYDHGRRLLLHRSGHPDDAAVVDPEEDPFAAGTKGLFEAFVDRTEGIDNPAPGPRDGTISLQVSRCIEESIKSGQPVEVPAL